MRPIYTLMRFCLLLCAATSVHALQVDGDAAIPGNELTGFEIERTSTDETHQGGGVSLSQAVAQVRRQYGGQIVSAETRVNGNRETHIIKVLTKDGKVKTVRVAGRSRG